MRILAATIASIIILPNHKMDEIAMNI
jgi:hypothetical protein